MKLLLVLLLGATALAQEGATGNLESFPSIYTTTPLPPFGGGPGPAIIPSKTATSHRAGPSTVDTTTGASTSTPQSSAVASSSLSSSVSSTISVSSSVSSSSGTTSAATPSASAKSGASTGRVGAGLALVGVAMGAMLFA